MRVGDSPIYKQFLPKNVDYSIISQYEEEDIDEGVKTEESTMYNNTAKYNNTTNSLVEKQQRHFRDRLQSEFWTKDAELQKKFEVERMVPTLELDYEQYQPAHNALNEAKKKVEDIIMLGDPIKMYEAVEAFQKITIH